MSGNSGRGKGCGADAGPVEAGLKGIVRHYIATKRRRRVRELEWYRAAPSLPEAILRAGRSLREDGKCEPHQRRVGVVRLRRFADRLLLRNDEIGRARDFDTLHHIVDECRMEGIGALTVYDTAVRIAAFLWLTPQRVYLHAGALSGARKLGVDVRDGVVDPEVLPREFRLLEPDEIEDCLCIYKDRFKREPKS